MAIVVLKILLAPALIAGVSLAGRRWGQVVSGWLVGLPLTAGPIVLFLGLQYGPAFAARAAAGTLMATLSEILFCYAYIRLAARGTVLALSGGAILFVGSAFILEYLAIPLPFGILAVVAALSWATRLVLSDIHSSMEVTRVQPPVWDIPARMITVAALVLALTAAAPFLGPRLAGLLAPFPLFASTLAAFAQHEYGPAAGRSVIMGLVLGLWGFAGFFLTVTATAKSAGIVAAVVIAAVVALAIQGATLWAISQNTPLPM